MYAPQRPGRAEIVPPSTPDAASPTTADTVRPRTSTDDTAGGAPSTFTTRSIDATLPAASLAVNVNT